MQQSSQAVGVVVIGRNEGERLKRCIRSLLGQDVTAVIYVDSGSSDGSVEFARSQGVVVVELDTSVPFTMARGRNAGFDKLREAYPRISYVQFVDGDCEVAPNWIAQGVAALDDDPRVVSVCGFRSELNRDASLYNRLIDLEWQGPTGEIPACGGDAMYRVQALEGVGGFNATLIAGEEPELCLRLRRAGGIIWRINQPMTRHDADMHSFAQWWKRAVRAGHALAEGFAMHGGPPEYHRRKPLVSCLIHGLLLPGVTALLAVAGILWSSVPIRLLAVGFGILLALAFWRVAYSSYRYRRALGNAPRDGALYALFCVIGKFPQAQGALLYARNRLFGRVPTLIEYRSGASGTAQ